MAIEYINLNPSSGLTLRNWANTTNKVIAATNTANTNLTLLISNVNTLTSAHTTTRNNLNSLVTNTNVQKTNLNTLISNVNTLTSAHTTTRNNLNSIIANVSILRTDLEGDDATLQNQIDDLQDQITALTTTVTTLSNLVNSFVTVTSSHITFKVNGVNQARMNTSGNLIVRNDITGFNGTIT